MTPIMWQHETGKLTEMEQYFLTMGEGGGGIDYKGVVWRNILT